MAAVGRVVCSAEMKNHQEEKKYGEKTVNDGTMGQVLPGRRIVFAVDGTDAAEHGLVWFVRNYARKGEHLVESWV